jgi:hypothetical protein
VRVLSFHKSVATPRDPEQRKSRGKCPLGRLRPSPHLVFKGRMLVQPTSQDAVRGRQAGMGGSDLQNACSSVVISLCHYHYTTLPLGIAQNFSVRMQSQPLPRPLYPSPCTTVLHCITLYSIPHPTPWLYLSSNFSLPTLLDPLSAVYAARACASLTKRTFMLRFS